MFCRTTGGVLVIAAVLSAGASLAATDSTHSPIVVCTREIGKPWSLLAHGDLVRITSANRVGYELRVRGQVFLYSVESQEKGIPQTPVPDSLTLISLLPDHPRERPTPRGPIVIPVGSQSISVDPEGYLREYIMLPNLGPLALITVAGSTCPTGRE